MARTHTAAEVDAAAYRTHHRAANTGEAHTRHSVVSEKRGTEKIVSQLTEGQTRHKTGQDKTGQNEMRRRKRMENH